jgi:uncharacterized linocin/CFP29 family protein
VIDFYKTQIATFNSLLKHQKSIIMSNSTEVNWDTAIWKDINDAVVQEMHKVRIAQKVFPTVVMDNDPTEIPNEVINFDNLSIQEGSTKPFAELFLEFSLTSAQVAKEAQLHTCKTLARMAAKQIALAEDNFIFNGKAANAVFPGNVTADPLASTFQGLLDFAGSTLNVGLVPNRKPDLLYGENTFAEVAEGIANLTDNAQAPNYALFLFTKIFADTYVPPSDASLVTTAERIKPLVDGGYYSSGSLPKLNGLLVALGGEPTTIYVGREASAEYLRKEGSKYIFRVVERVQFVARDPRAYIKLAFDAPPVAAPAGGGVAPAAGGGAAPAGGGAAPAGGGAAAPAGGGGAAPSGGGGVAPAGGGGAAPAGGGGAAPAGGGGAAPAAGGGAAPAAGGGVAPGK